MMDYGFSRSAIGMKQQLDQDRQALEPRQAIVIRSSGPRVWVRFIGEGTTATAAQFASTISGVPIGTQGLVYPTRSGKGFFMPLGISVGGMLNVQTIGLQSGVDATADMQDLLTNAPDGTTIAIPDQFQLLVSSQVTASNKSISIVGYGNAAIVATQKLSVPAIYLDNAPGSRISGVRFIGAETAFDAVTNSQAFAFQIANSPHAKVTDVHIQGFSRGGFITSSDYATVTGLSFDGMINGYETNSNYHSALQVNSSDDCVLTNVTGTNLGNVILVGSHCNRMRIVTPTGDNVYDAGVYISSGHYCEVFGSEMTTRADYTGNIGNGVSIKGNYNTVWGGVTTGMGYGSRITGNGIPDADGLDGYGNRVIGHRAINCKVAGFQIGSGNGGPSKDSKILDCHVEGGGEGYTNHLGQFVAALGGIVVYGGRGNAVRGNTVTGFTTTYSLNLIGSGTGGVKNTEVSHNYLRHSGTNGKSAAMWMDACEDVDVTDNTFESISNTYGIRAGGGSTKCRFRGNTRIKAATVTLAGTRFETGTSAMTAINNPTMSFADDTNTAILSGNDGSATANLSITGSRGGNAALTSLLQKLAAAGIIRDTTTV